MDSRKATDALEVFWILVQAGVTPTQAITLLDQMANKGLIVSDGRGGSIYYKGKDFWIDTTNEVQKGQKGPELIAAEAVIEIFKKLAANH